MTGARRLYLSVSRTLFDLPPDRRPEALAALAGVETDPRSGVVRLAGPPPEGGATDGPEVQGRQR